MSYNDADLGYELGYDTDTVISSTIHAPTQAQGHNSGVTYSMNPLTEAAARGDWTRVYEIVSGAVEDGAPVSTDTVSGPTGTPTIPSGYEEGARLAALEGRSEGEEVPVEGTGETVSTSEMTFTRSDMVMDEFTGIDGNPGILAGAGLTENQQGMFAEVFAGRDEEFLNTLRQQEGESTEAYRERLEAAMVTEFGRDVGGRIERRFAPGTVENLEIQSMTSAAIRTHTEGTTAREISSSYVPGETRDAVYAMVDTIPTGSRMPSETSLYTEGARHEEERFFDSVLETLREEEPRRYRGDAGERRAREEGELFLASEGVDRSDPAALRALTESPDFASRLHGFSESIRGMSDRERSSLLSQLIANREENASEDARAERSDASALARQITDRLMAHANATAEADQAHVHRFGEGLVTEALRMTTMSLEAANQAANRTAETTNNMITTRPMTVGEIMAMVRNQPTSA